MESVVKSVRNKFAEILKETFVKNSTNFINSTNSNNSTRNYSASFSDKLATSAGFGVMVYACLIFGCFGSLLSKKIPELSSMVETVSKSSAQRSPLIASCVLFGIFVLSKFIPLKYIIMFITVYMVVCSIFTSYLVIEYSVLYLFGLLDKVVKYEFSLSLKKKGQNTSLFHYPFTFTVYSVLAILFSVVVCAWYILSDKFWVANNIIAILICVYAISVMHIPKLSYGVTLLAGLLLYDIFWVFGTNVMVSVATKLDVPVKLLFPNDLLSGGGLYSKSLSLLGLGDIVLPGLFIAFLLRFDSNSSNNGGGMKGRPFFYSGLVGYGVGMAVTTAVLYTFKSGQPALLYLVPGIFLSTFICALATGRTQELWAYEEQNEIEGDAETTNSEDGKFKSD